MTSPAADSSGLGFPAGPTYPVLLDSAEGFAWVRYKVWSADWYADTLEQLRRQLGDYDRHVGIEMALDGALGALSGAFDSGVALLIRGIEDELDVAEASRTPPQKFKWPRFKSLAEQLDREQWPTMSTLIDDIDTALVGGSSDVPTGWLAVLRRLRNRPTHESTLPRTWAIDGQDHVVVGLSAPLEDDAAAYIKLACDRVSDLSERMVAMANSLGFVGPYTPLLRTRWFAAE